MKFWFGLALLMVIITGGILVQSNPVDSNGKVLSAFTTANDTPDVNELFDQINEQRKHAGAPELDRSPVLSDIAIQRAEDMVSKKYYAHESPEGTYFYDLLPANMSKDYSCENLNLQFTKRTERYVTEWLNSDSHKKCMLNKSVTQAGYAAIKYSDPASGQESYIVVAIHAE